MICTCRYSISCCRKVCGSCLTDSLTDWQADWHFWKCNLSPPVTKRRGAFRSFVLHAFLFPWDRHTKLRSMLGAAPVRAVIFAPLPTFFSISITKLSSKTSSIIDSQCSDSNRDFLLVLVSLTSILFFCGLPDRENLLFPANKSSNY